MIENFNVREVISIPNDQFENTTTKTSLVIFDNTEEKTSKIKFSKLDVVKYTENKIEEKNGCLILTEMVGDISGCQEVAVSTATIQDVQQNPIYSLNGKDYNQTEIVCGEDYELVEMKDLCKIRLGTRITKKNNTNTIMQDLLDYEDGWIEGEKSYIDLYALFKKHGLPASATAAVRGIVEGWLLDYEDAYHKRCPRRR